MMEEQTRKEQQDMKEQQDVKGQQNRKEQQDMKEQQDVTCISCPLGCAITVTMDGSGISSVSGNTCPRGEAYARKEVTNPTRIVTSSVRLKNGRLPMVSCKTKQDVPKDKIFAVTEALRHIEVEAPIHTGDVLLKNVAGTGVDIIATKTMEKVL